MKKIVCGTIFVVSLLFLQMQSLAANTISIQKIDPTIGHAGTPITITGSGFEDPDIVLFDNIAVKPVTITKTELKCIIPNGLSGKLVTLVLENPKTGERSNEIKYPIANEMVITSLAPYPIPLSGATETITGSGFKPGAFVVINGIEIHSIETSESKIVFPAPSVTAPMKADLWVVNSDGETVYMPIEYK